MKGNLAVGGLRCEHLTDPLGVGAQRPRLSWVVQSDRNGAKQTAYQVVVDGVWDSGRVPSDSGFVLYDGPPLASRQRCEWRVKVWDGEVESAWSDAAVWEMGLLSPSDWTASWITAIRPFVGEDGHGAARYFRTSFDLPDAATPASGRAYVTALGLYELYVNGERVSDAAFRPGWTDYDKRVQYQVYDITPLLRPGRNAVGAVVGDGWYAGNIGMGKKQVWGEWQELFAQIEVTLADGTAQTVPTSRTWRTSKGPIVENDLQHGEVYDARLELDGWSTPDFDDSGWDGSWPGGGSVGALSPTRSQPVRALIERTPIAKTEPAPDTWVFDLGQNIVGWCRLRVSGPEGTTVTLRHAEMLNPDGTLYTENLRGAPNVDRYTLKGEGEEVWAPRFTFHGFRYVELTGFPGEPGMDAVTGVVAHSDTPQTGSFECSNPLVNQLMSNIMWGQRGNFLEVPTDCPQRDERLGWMGDAQIFVAAATLNMDVAAFFAKWLQDMRDAQLEIGAYPDVIPRFGRANPPAAPAWADAGVIVPWTLYRRYGDVRFLEEHFESMTAWVDYIHLRNPDLRWRTERGMDWGDWVAIGSETPKDVVASMWWANSARLVSRAAEVLGRKEDAQRYAELADGIADAWRADHLRPDGTIEGETQTLYALAIRFGLADAGLASPHLLADIAGRDTHLSTGFMGIAHLLPALTDVGATDVAYKLLLNETFPSWGYSIRHGATTIWERWDGWTEENGFQNPGMNSFNHYAFGAVGEWVYEVVGGVRVDFTAATPIVIAPVPGDGLDWARTSFESVLGTVGCEWARTDDGAGLTLVATVPIGAAAEVRVPAQSRQNVLVASGEGAELAGRTDDAAVYRVGSGRYEFQVRT